MYSSRSEITFGVRQGFILGSLVFNVFLLDLIQCYPDLDISNYADGNILHSTNTNLNNIL